MNKKLLLIALPALMTLSACSGAFGPQKAANLMAEDTVAHEEVFGDAAEAKELALGKLSPRKIAFDEDFVKVGYQMQLDEHGEGDADDTVSIRLVAAIKDINVKAYWHRGFAQPNGYEGANTGTELEPNWKYKLNDGVVNESKKYYTTLNDGGVAINANAGDYAGYQGFIIYTLLNIPYETYKNAYLGAYVEVVDPEDGTNTQKSKFMAVKVEQTDPHHSANVFSFETNALNGKHFLQGIIDGDKTVYLEDETTLDAGNNYASYKDVDLLADDYFGSYYFSTEHFQFFGHDSFFAESVDLFEESDELEEYVSPKAAGRHTLFISKGSGKENHVYSAKDEANHAFTATSVPGWVGDGDAAIFASVQHANNVWYWVGGAFDTDHITFNAPANIKAFLLVRCPNGTVQPDWSATGDNLGRIYNKTGDIATSSEVYSYEASSWSEYSPS